MASSDSKNALNGALVWLVLAVGAAAFGWFILGHSNVKPTISPASAPAQQAPAAAPAQHQAAPSGGGERLNG